MKKLYSIFSLLTIAAASHAQTFWTEDFGTGCNRGQAATAYTSTNGPWTMATTGTNGNVANTWFVSATSAGTGTGNCSSNCITSSTTNASLHVSNTSIIIPSFLTVNADTGASYFSGGLSGFGYVASTNARAESPIINCSGKTNISASFTYIENGDGANDDASFCYSADGGTTWSTIDPLVKTTACSGGGIWTTVSISLPASANNNSFVKIGFTWTNNDDGVGTDPSFAVDDITISQTPTTGITSYSNSALSIFSKGNGTFQINANGQTYKILGIYNMLGQQSKYTQTGNTIQLDQQMTGVYFISLDVNGTRLIKKVAVN